MDSARVSGMLGLAARAGKIASGEFCTEKMVKSHRAYLVIVAEDASENTKKMFRNMCAHYKVPFYYFSDKETLGHMIGREMRTSVAIIEEGFARAVERQLNQGDNNGGNEHGE